MDKRPENGGGKTPATTGLELSFAIHTSAALEIRAVTAAEIEAKQRDEEGQDLNVDITNCDLKTCVSFDLLDEHPGLDRARTDGGTDPVVATRIDAGSAPDATVQV